MVASTVTPPESPRRPQLEGSAMKKLIDHPEDVVREALDGMARARRPPGGPLRSALHRARGCAGAGQGRRVSGGGSGHEPMHGGFVGPGMLDAACPGAVFTSPTPDQMLAATQAVNGGAGVLHIVKNYTGDVMNFEMAADLARDEGMEVEAVLINDDVAVKDSLYTAGRRGVGAHGAGREDRAAPRRRRAGRWPEVAGVCRKRQRPAAAWAWRSPPAPCRRPAARPSTCPTTRWRSASASTASRGASGVPLARARDRRTLAAASSTTCPSAAATGCWLSSTAWAARRSSSSTSCTMNWPGISPDRGITIVRNLVGSYITSLDMAGCSITLLRMDDELARLWDAPVRTPALRWGASAAEARLTTGAPQVHRSVPRRGDANASSSGCARSPTTSRPADYLTELDSAIGDADHGINMDRGFQAVVAKLPAPDGPGAAGRRPLGPLFKTVGMTLISTVGGASGPLYGTLFLGMGRRPRRARR